MARMDTDRGTEKGQRQENEDGIQQREGAEKSPTVDSAHFLFLSLSPYPC